MIKTTHGEIEMFVLPLDQVSCLSFAQPSGSGLRQAITYQGRTFVLKEVHQGLQTAIQRCRQFLDNNTLTIVVDHGGGLKASLWSELIPLSHQDLAVGSALKFPSPQEMVSLEDLLSCFKG